MGLTISEKGGSSFKPLDEGTYTAVCFELIDLGMQFNERFGTTSRKVVIGWEIMGESVEIDGEKKPRTFSQTYTASLNERAVLRSHLKAWRGRDFTEEELAAFDLRSIVGAPCMIQIVHTNKDGKTYANLASIMKLPKQMGAVTGTLPKVIYDIDVDDPAMVATLPEWMAKMIYDSSSYKERVSADPPKMEEIEDDGELPF